MIALLSAHYAWATPERIEMMTMRQIELWVHLALKDRQQQAELIGAYVARPIGEMLAALFRKR